MAVNDEKERRRTKGDGALFQRADGVWVGRVEIPAGPDGARRRKTVSSRSFDKAAAELRKLRTAVDEGRIAVTGNTTVAKWLERWLTEVHAEKIRPTTRRDYQSAIGLHINPSIGTKRLDKLTTAHIRQMHTAIGSRRAAEKAHVILKKALKDAVREGMLTYNVAERVDAPRYRKAKRTSMSVGLAQRVIGTALVSRDVSQATRWAAAFLTGARQGELLGLRWSYVNLDHGTMNISWQLQHISKAHGCGEKTADGWPCGLIRPGYCPQQRWDLPPDFEYEVCHHSLVWTRPKTAAGSREIPILPPLLIKLRELAAKSGANPHDLVWHHPDGRPISPSDDYKTWKQLLIDAGVIAPKDQTLPMHVARHSCATLLRAAGVDEQTRMEILGHSTVDSQRVYAHADRTRHLDAMTSSRLSELMTIPKGLPPGCS